MGDAVIFYGVCDHIGTGAHLRQGIAHCHADTGQLQHFQIVFGISKGLSLIHISEPTRRS